MPENLRAAAGDPGLARTVTQVVEGSGESAAFRAMLGVLVYCYADGVYASAEIARLWSVASGFLEDETALRRYRRHHLGKIKGCLAQVLATASPNVRGHADAASEAESRLLRAIQEDSWALDY